MSLSNKNSKDKSDFFGIVSNHPSMLELFEIIKKISKYDTTVLIQGESGTGKELIARAIHNNSNRKNKKFFAINCGAIPENLLESELFGHKKGAFTDATKDKKGLFEEANGGTLLLDEIGELPIHLQVKLLRALQENQIKPVGSSETIKTDVRILAASLRDLEKDISQKRFRNDLFYRLNVISLYAPPLRERKEDIPILVNHFLKKIQKKLGLLVTGITKEASEVLLNYNWPGNVRELENSVERAMILTEGENITIKSLPPNTKKNKTSTEPIISLEKNENLSIKKHLRDLEEFLIKTALKRTNGNKTKAATLLEISHRALLYKIKDYNL